MRSLTMILILSLFPLSCATAPRPVEIESVGQLAASESHVMQAPVHEGTNLSAGFQAISADDDAPVAAVAGEVVETPAIEAKTALVMGGAR